MFLKRVKDMEQKKLELYLHIPFCIRKCAYCDFLSAPADAPTREDYVEALVREIKRKGQMYAGYSVPSLFIGGGTPSVLSGEELIRVMEAVAASFFIEKSAEITIECNPGTLNEKKAADYRRAGINRVSIGLQSAIGRELALLGRIHTWEDFLKSYDILRRAGFSNINVDLMAALPGQTFRDWEYTLTQTVRLRPEHISAYSLLIEEGTPFFERYGEDAARRRAGGEPELLPDEETEVKMYEFTGSFLKKHGYRQYEISNYARPGMECRHNIGYWTLVNYLGLGLGSASLVEGERFSNTSNLGAYLGGDFEKKERQTLSRRNAMEEYMFLGLRMRAGVSREEFHGRFGVEPEAVYGQEIARLCTQGLLEQQAGRLRLTEEGILAGNYVMAEFIK